jgi:hypothetical protein
LHCLRREFINAQTVVSGDESEANKPDKSIVVAVLCVELGDCCRLEARRKTTRLGRNRVAARDDVLDNTDQKGFHFVHIGKIRDRDSDAPL